MNLEKKPGWIIHYVANGAVCEDCGCVEDGFPQYICDAHTHGVSRYDNHLKFQLILNYGMNEAGRLLNEMGFRVQAGERFKSGDWVKGLYEDCDVFLYEIPDSNNVPVLRLVIPDKNNRMPEDSDYPHSLQYAPINDICSFYRKVRESGFELNEGQLGE